MRVRRKRFRLRPIHGSSEKFGACEVCGGRVSDVFMQIEVRWFKTDAEDPEPVRASPYYQASAKFGHETCLVISRKFGRGAADV